MNALSRNAYTEGWARLAASMPPPEAILCISAHWYMPGTAVTAMTNPKTIHDFGGFPRELYEVQYPAPGSVELAQRVADLLAPEPVAMDRGWGLDHGTWSVLVHAYPDADIPVVQLSIDETKEAPWHYEVAKRLQPLRDEGVLVMGSGNIVHNLHAYSWGNHVIGPYDWAERFDTRARELLARADFAPLVAYEELGRDAMLSAPTPNHYLSLVYVMAAPPRRAGHLPCRRLRRRIDLDARRSFRLTRRRLAGRVQAFFFPALVASRTRRSTGGSPPPPARPLRIQAPPCGTCSIGRQNRHCNFPPNSPSHSVKRQSGWEAPEQLGVTRISVARGVFTSPENCDSLVVAATKEGARIAERERESRRHGACYLRELTTEGAMTDRDNQTRTSKGARGARNGGDARREPDKQKENQKRLGVGADHKTPEMKKGHRGTFP